ncbi:MAG TPA: proline/glycine betaine ABC transporter permease [Bacillales bacterium]|nr:proline/glycine betaine ABC transporter permease [Bacillales bacterium]
MDERFLPRLPLKNWVNDFVDFLKEYLQGFFDVVATVIESVADFFVFILQIGHPFLLIIVISLIAWWTAKWKVAVFSFLGLWLINNLGYWVELTQTLSLILISVIISILIGIPIGIWMSQKNAVRSVVTPILDFMQTMPAFVYLIPAVVFFGLGMVPGVIATVIFAMPPTVRLTDLGIRQVPGELIEAANAFGSTTGQRLSKVQIPLATPTIMAGINQSIMLSLSMVVIASLVGAPGLGTIVYRAVTQIKIGLGFEGGLSLVIIAMILDRISQGIKK